MGLIETNETNKFTFEAFASHKFYTEVNRSLVRHALARYCGEVWLVETTILSVAPGLSNLGLAHFQQHVAGSEAVNKGVLVGSKGALIPYRRYCSYKE